MNRGFAIVAALASYAAGGAAFARCTVENFGLLQVSMQRNRPVTEGEINGTSVRFMVDSGAFFSTLGPAKARELGLPTTPLPNIRIGGIGGIGGSASAAMTTVKELKIAGVALKNVQFIVAGSDTGFAGLIGQNVLGIRNVEYDLHHGAVRLMDPKDCKGATLAYWAEGLPVSALRLEKATGANRHSIGTVLLNGVKLRAGFDTGAGGTVVTPRAARRAGVKTDDPGVESVGFGLGIGSEQVPAWLGTFESIDVGGEKLRNVKLRIQELGGELDMLIGIDFLLSHRVYVSNELQTMFFTYEGGPIFGVTPKRAVTAEGETVAVKDSGAEPTDATGYSARGTASTSKRDFESALADFDRAIELEPDNGRYWFQRAQAQLALRQLSKANADLDKAKVLSPQDPDVLLFHANMALAQRHRDAALSDASAVDALLAPEAQARLSLGELYLVLDEHEKALASFDNWLDHHDKDGIRPVALNGRCWARFHLNRDMDKALSDCNMAIRLQPDTAAYLDSRGMVRMRLGEYDRAIEDLSAALDLEPRMASTRYARGIARAKLGEADAAKRDKEEALTIDRDVAGEVEKWGL